VEVGDFDEKDEESDIALSPVTTSGSDDDEDVGWRVVPAGPVGNRDATYLKIYGNASNYIGKMFKDITTTKTWKVKRVVKNVRTENSSDELYFKCSLMSSELICTYEYRKCRDMMNRQGRRRMHDWIQPVNKGVVNKRVVRQRSSKSSQWTGYAILGADENRPKGLYDSDNSA
jgi:hypothetical protein